MLWKTATQNNLGRKGGFLAYKLSLTAQGRQGRNLEAQTESEATKDSYLPACSSWLALSAFLYNPRLSSRRHTLIWTLPHQSIIKERPLKPQANLMKALPAEVSSSMVTLVLSQVDKNGRITRPQPVAALMKEFTFP